MESWVVALLLWPFTRNQFFEFCKPFFLFPKRQSKGARGFIEWLRYTAAHVTRGYQNLLENWIRLYHCLSPISKGPEGICGFVYENQREWKITKFYPHSMDCVIFFFLTSNEDAFFTDCMHICNFPFCVRCTSFWRIDNGRGESHRVLRMVQQGIY